MHVPLRTDLLAGLPVLMAGGGGAAGAGQGLAGPGEGAAGAREGVDPALAAALSALGAEPVTFAPVLDEAGEGGAEWVRAQAPQARTLVFDGRRVSGGGEGVEPLRAVMDAAWIAIAASVNGAMLGATDEADGADEADRADGADRARGADRAEGAPGGRIVLVAPERDAAWWAPAAGDALENLARTLSVEWARHRITITAVVPAAATEPDVLAGVVAFLLSPAGSYHTGSRLDLDGL